MTFESLPAYALPFLLGALLAWLVTSILLQRRAVAARERALTERARRQELEEELEQAQGALRDLDRRLAVADERLTKTADLLEEQRAFVERSRKELEDAFKALAASALRSSSEQFLSLAEQKLAAHHTRASSDLEERKQAIEALLAPFKDSLEKLDHKTGEIERARVDAYSRIDQQIQHLSRATTALEEKTTSLSAALKGTQVRGRWGEIALRNIAELAGMSAHCDFEEQVTLEDGRRPDMVVRLPGERRIAVDAKAPLTGYLEASEAVTEAAREKALDRHVRDLRSHIRALAARDYAGALGAEVDLVVMFLPGDPFLGAAFDRDPDLQVEALRSKVLIATPTTLVALLRTVAIYWQQHTLAENATVIAETARELYERAAKFGEELANVGRGLKGALDAYNRAVGSFDRRLRPLARRLEEMKVAEQTRRELQSPDPVSGTPREPG